MNSQQNEERIRRAKEEIAQDAKTIDPRTAEMVWWYAQVVDPYGLLQEIPLEEDCVGREYFLVDRSRGTNAVLVSDVRAAHSEIRDEQWEELMRAAAERDTSPDPFPMFHSYSANGHRRA